MSSQQRSSRQMFIQVGRHTLNRQIPIPQCVAPKGRIVTHSETCRSRVCVCAFLCMCVCVNVSMSVWVSVFVCRGRDNNPHDWRKSSTRQSSGASPLHVRFLLRSSVAGFVWFREGCVYWNASNVYTTRRRISRQTPPTPRKSAVRTNQHSPLLLH